MAVIPLHYDLLFEPDLRRATFAGQERIELTTSRTRSLTLHAADLRVHSARVLWNRRELRAKVALFPDREQLLVTLPRPIRGRATLCLTFSGTLNDRLVGFYQSRASTAGSGRRSHLLATTQFEAADARRAFPCWDEPAAKATFTVSILADAKLTAISNMPVAATRRLGHKTLFNFTRTPRMPTYLLYLGVGPFESVSARWPSPAIQPSGAYAPGSFHAGGPRRRSVRLRVLTVPGKQAQGRLALRFAKEFLAFFEQYFCIRYPLPKLDLIALPDFASGAMENWGAITFRETALLFDPKTGSAATKQRIAEIVAHELAHQWFGNLVTMRWWNDLWLNESFATFMATKAVAARHPKWQLWDQFIESDLAAALSVDALRSSHPIEVRVRAPGEIREIFDEISYEKGGSVLRMLESHLGERAFRKGLHRYLTKHAYANATTADLWRALAASSRKPVRTIMDSWTAQTGYPLVTATRHGKTLHLHQQRFLYKGPGPGRWHIPLTLRTPAGARSVLFSRKQLTLAAPGWCKLNAGESGPYRVQYDPAHLRTLLRAPLQPADRWGLQNDLLALAVAGQELAPFLEAVQAYAGDESYLVSAGLANSLLWLLLLSGHDRIVTAALPHFRALADRLSWDPRPHEPHTDTLLRASALVGLGRLDDPGTLRQAQERFAAFLRTGTLHPDLRMPVYLLVASAGDAALHRKFIQLYRKAPTQEEKVRLLAGLANFPQPALIRRTLAFALSKAVRTQDLTTPIMRAAANPAAQRILWPWFRAHWPALARRFGHIGSPLLNRAIKSLGLLADVRAAAGLRRLTPVPGTERSFAQTIERIEANARFLARLRKELTP